MKTNLTLSLDLELVELLKKEENMSGLVNDLIQNHFHETTDFKKMRIMNELKLLRQEEIELKIRKNKIEDEVRAFTKMEVRDGKKQEIKG
jgi:hypothetical protein